ncbi:hypothetical protein LENED_000010 [Lentinula edodes]|uniref:Uncharacterized protein n=1 Tax=Lentinula edodes TaxID=5353 RepID=A0A1Q3DUE0_LENED|nr:hypothetical protein LENED_000010 [Lentinula edodes]
MLGQTGLGTVISDTNSSGSDYDDYHYTNHTDSQIQPRHIQLDSRGKGLKKSLIRAALWLNPDWALLGFAYVTPEEGEVVGDGNGVQLGTLKLPTMQLDSTKTPGFIYLQPKLGMPAQNPDNRYWTCLVYASKKNINKFKPQMFYRSELAPNQSPPPYTHSSTADDRVNSQAITFFSDPSFAGVTVMQVPFSAKFVSDWQLLAECYKSPNKLPKEVKPSWDSWKEKIEGLPKGMNLWIFLWRQKSPPPPDPPYLASTMHLTFPYFVFVLSYVHAAPALVPRVAGPPQRTEPKFHLKFIEPSVGSLKPEELIRDRIRAAIKTAPNYGSIFEYVVYDNQCNIEDPRFAGEITVKFWTNVKDATDGCTEKRLWKVNEFKAAPDFLRSLSIVCSLLVVSNYSSSVAICVHRRAKLTARVQQLTRLSWVDFMARVNRRTPSVRMNLNQSAPTKLGFRAIFSEVDNYRDSAQTKLSDVFALRSRWI